MALNCRGRKGRRRPALELIAQFGRQIRELRCLAAHVAAHLRPGPQPENAGTTPPGNLKLIGRLDALVQLLGDIEVAL